jgi:type IV secretion system protein TrbE
MLETLLPTRGKGRAPSRLSRSGMPNGFFVGDLLYFGDGGSKKTAVSRGFIVEPPELDILDGEAKIDVSERLRVLLATLGNEYTLQVKYLICSDYSDVLEAYRLGTEAIGDKYRYRWQIWNRTERYERYKEAMESGKLRREVLSLFFSRVIDSAPGFHLSEKALEEHFRGLATREALAFAEINGGVLQTIFPDCRVRTMGKREHFLAYYRFLNPNVGSWIPEEVFEAYDESRSIQENCLFGDITQPESPGVSFSLDSLHHAILAMRELPKRIGPGLITRLTDLGFVDYELTLNIYPQKTDKVVKSFENTANQIEGEIRTKPKGAFRLGTQLEMAKLRIAELERGEFFPIDVFLALRLWHKDPDTVVSRASVVKNAFVSMAGSTCHHATNAETARQLFYQTWPGWTYGTYRGYDLPSDDQTVAELIPWSASFTGRLDNAEALYDSAKGGLVGLATEVSKVPQHMLVFGAVGVGKSILFTDLLGQIGHLFRYLLIVEEGLSHATTVQTLGGEPIIVTPNGEVTINYYDTGGTPLTNEHIGGAVALCLQMLRESGPNVDPARVSRIQSNLTRHILHLYNTHWDEWRRLNPEREADIARRALGIQTYLRTRMKGHNNTFLDAYAELRDWEASKTGDAEEFLAALDEGEIAKFSTHHSTKDVVRDLGLSYLAPEEFPTHGELVEMMTMVPIDGEDENPEAVDIGHRLRSWTRQGPYGKLFDGISTTRLDGNVTHFELGLIPESLEEMRAAAHFLVLNTSRQQVIKRPRAQRKLCLFEEGARVIQAPGGSRVLKEFYAQMRKFAATVCTVFQQYGVLKDDEKIRTSVFDNTKLFLVSAQPSPAAAEEIGKALKLSETAEESIRRFPLPEHQIAKVKYSSFLMYAPQPTRALVGTLRNIASPEVIYCGKSDNEVFDQRAKELTDYDDVVEGILRQSRKAR